MYSWSRGLCARPEHNVEVLVGRCAGPSSWGVFDFGFLIFFRSDNFAASRG